jgi:hypothetical protein
VVAVLLGKALTGDRSVVVQTRFVLVVVVLLRLLQIPLALRQQVVLV